MPSPFQRVREWLLRMPEGLDEDRRELARLLIGLNALAVAPSVAYLVALLAFSPQTPSRAAAVGVATALQLGTVIATRRGFVYRAAATNFGVFAVLVAFSAYRGGGIGGVVTTSLFVLIVVLSFVPKRAIAIAGTGFACATLVGLYAIERAGRLPAPTVTYGSLESLLGFRLTVCILIGIFATLGATALRRARDRARLQREELAQRAWQQEGLAKLSERALDASDIATLRAEADALIAERLGGEPGTAELSPSHRAAFLRSVESILAAAEARFASDAARRASEAQLRQAQKLEAVGRLASGIAHDFNNLMTVVLAQAAILRRTDPPRARWQEGLDAIEDAGSRAAGITRQLLALGRNQVLDLRVVSLDDVVEGVRELLDRLLGERHEVEIERSADPLRVRVDVTQLQQVLINLAINARDAMPGGGRITIRTARASDREVLVAVRDHGSGMTPEVRDRIFDPFFTTKEGGRGTGLGLAVADGIVQQSGGRLECDSEVGVGTELRVILPAVTAPCVPSPEVPTSRDGRSPPQRRWTLLLVEDQPAVRRALRRSLELYGSRVEEAASGEEALARFEAVDPRPDAIVTDVVMPGMDGVTLSRRLRALSPDVPILFLSGHPMDAIAELDLERPATAYLQKPCTARSLDDALAALLHAVPARARPRGVST